MECARLRTRGIKPERVLPIRSDADKKLSKFNRIKQWRLDNLDHCRLQLNNWDKAKRKSDPNHKLKDNLRRRVKCAIDRAKKGPAGKTRGGSAVRDLGCTIDECVIYIELQFRDSMSWDNWGTVWQLDHVKPLFSFDLTDRGQFLVAAHYTNLRPLLIDEHRQKSVLERLSSTLTKRVSLHGRN
jgi:hypothetical protein